MLRGKQDDGEPLAEFGRRVRALRLGRHLSQEQLADRSGLHRTYITSLEQGKRNIALRNILRLAVALGVDPAELVQSLGNPNESKPRERREPTDR